MLSFPCMTLVIVTSSTQLLSSNEFSPLPIIIILKFLRVSFRKLGIICA